MKHLQLFEEFETFKKPTFLQRTIKQGKDIVGIENRNHRKIIEEIKDSIRNQSNYDLKIVKDVRIIEPGVLVAYINNRSLIVDTETPEIIYQGETLDIKNLELEALELYDILKIN